MHRLRSFPPRRTFPNGARVRVERWQHKPAFDAVLVTLTDKAALVRALEVVDGVRLPRWRVVNVDRLRSRRSFVAGLDTKAGDH